jgi:CRISPR-associated protein Csm3
MYGKIEIRCRLKVLTGMHITGSGAFSAIGAVDKPVITDPRTLRPILPGSSLKGKLRTLLARSEAEDITKMLEPNKDKIAIRRLFGSSEPIEKARLQFADAFVVNKDSFGDIPLTEIKMENTINRVTGVANPRQIERVISGVEFDVAIVYDIHADVNEVPEDMKLLAKAMRLLQLDYLGGHGTRGSGRVSFKTITVTPIIGRLDADMLETIRREFKEVEQYELMSV